MEQYMSNDKFQSYFSKIHKWDVHILYKLYKYAEKHNLQKWARYLSFLGDPRIWGMVIVGSGIYGLIQLDFTYLVVFFTGFFQSYLFYFIFKEYFQRKRPFEQFEDIKHWDKTGHGHSFPSGHCHHSTILISLFWVLFFPNPWFFLILLTYNLIIALSRMMTGCHFPSDTIFGTFEAYLEIVFFWFVTKDLYLHFYEIVMEMLF
jgi:membrane-associated phospholipid phosphatase